jgi:hypothetical protein
MAFYPALQSRMYSSTKDTFPARRNPLWMSAQDRHSNTDIGIYEGRSGPNALNHDYRLHADLRERAIKQNHFQKNASAAAHHIYEPPLNHLEQNPLYRSPMSEVSANPSRSSRPARALVASRAPVPAPSGSSEPYGINEGGMQGMVNHRAIQMLQVAFAFILIFDQILLVHAVLCLK